MLAMCNLLYYNKFIYLNSVAYQSLTSDMSGEKIAKLFKTNVVVINVFKRIP